MFLGKIQDLHHRRHAHRENYSLYNRLNKFAHSAHKKGRLNDGILAPLERDIQEPIFSRTSFLTADPRVWNSKELFHIGLAKFETAIK